MRRKRLVTTVEFTAQQTHCHRAWMRWHSNGPCGVSPRTFLQPCIAWILGGIPDVVDVHIESGAPGHLAAHVGIRCPWFDLLPCLARQQDQDWRLNTRCADVCHCAGCLRGTTAASPYHHPARIRSRPLRTLSGAGLSIRSGFCEWNWCLDSDAHNLCCIVACRTPGGFLRRMRCGSPHRVHGRMGYALACGASLGAIRRVICVQRHRGGHSAVVAMERFGGTVCWLGS